MRNELDLTYGQPIFLKILALAGINYQRIPSRLRNLYGGLPKRKRPGRSFPIDIRGVDKEIDSPWKGTFALCLTHDIDTKYGMEKGVDILADVERRADVPSTWCVVPRSRLYRPRVDKLRDLESCGDEIAAHGLYHDGMLPYVAAAEREVRIATSFQLLAGMGLRPSGFRAPLLQRTRDLIAILEMNGFLWDSSCPDSDPTSPGYEGSGCATIFPFRPLIRRKDGFLHSSVLELPITLPQDWTLIHSLRYDDGQLLRLWKRKLDFIAGLGGIALLLTHPDSYDFGNSKRARVYDELIRYALSKGPVSLTCKQAIEMWNRCNPFIERENSDG